MKTVTVRNIAHNIYETEQEFRKQYPDLAIKDTLANTEVNDWCWTKQGFIVQCLNKQQLTETKNRRTPRTSYTFTFPRVKVSARGSKLNERPYYFPTNEKNISGQDPESYNLINKPKVRLFAEYIRNGLSPQQAYTTVFGILRPRQISFLLSRKDVIDHIMKGNKKLMKSELETAGLNKTELAKQIAKIVTNEKENPVIRKWALEFVTNVYSATNTQTDEMSDPLREASMMMVN